jgi:hypothetical protein
MSRSQTSFLITDNVVRKILFSILPGASRDPSIYDLNISEAVITNSDFLIGQSKILGFKRILSSPNPANNGTPFLCNYGVVQSIPSDNIVIGTTKIINVYNPYKETVLYLTSSSNNDTSMYEMYFINEYANPEVAQSLGLVSQAVFPQ